MGGGHWVLTSRGHTESSPVQMSILSHLVASQKEGVEEPSVRPLSGPSVWAPGEAPGSCGFPPSPGPPSGSLSPERSDRSGSAQVFSGSRNTTQ